MRIIAGRYGGRRLQAPPSPATRPMSDKVRGALFNILGPLADQTVLDAYAGSGAVALEALSRGAHRAVAIEASRRAARTVRANARVLGLDSQLQLIESTVQSWLATADPTATTAKPAFQLIVADPPYQHLDLAIVERLAEHLLPGGNLIISHTPAISLPATLGTCRLIQTKTYGDSALSFYTLS